MLFGFFLSSGRSLLPHLHFVLVAVLTGDGKSNNQGNKLLKVNVAVAVAVQILHDFVHSSRVLLRLQGQEENIRVVSSRL